MKDFQHKLSREIVDNTRSNTLIAGDLSVQEVCSQNRYQKGLHTPHHYTEHIGIFVRFLTYKAQLVGKRLVEIDERKTSKRCSIWDVNRICRCIRGHMNVEIVVVRRIEMKLFHKYDVTPPIPE